jgi:hypothetical protein
MNKVTQSDPARRVEAAPSARRRLFASGVIRPARDPRPSVREAARVDGAVFRITVTPEPPRAA